MDAFVEHLKSLCKEHPTRSKWVVVPGHHVGRTIGDRLVLEGTDWANLRFVTPLDLALRMGAPYLVERGIDPSEDQLGPALIMRLLLGLPDAHAYFRPLAHEPRMAMALWSTIRELRAAGVRAADLHADHFESAAKHAELQALLDAYERHLVDHKLGDHATVYEEALKHPEWCPVKAEDCWTVLPGVRWTPLQQQLLALVKGERTDCGLGTADCGPGAAHFFTAGGPEAEVEEVMRRILKSGRKLDEVEIACASEGYSTLLWEKACRYEWPVTLATGLPATLTRPGRALLGLIEWVEDNFAAGKLRRLFQSGDIRISERRNPGTSEPKNPGTPDPGPWTLDLGPSRAAKLLVKADAAWGRATYRLSLARLAKSARARAKEDISDDEREYQERSAQEAEALAQWIDALVTTIPEPGPDGLVDLQPLVLAAVAFVEGIAARASALDHAAADKLAASLSELRALGDFRCPLGQALRFLRERVESLHIGADRPRPGHLHISQLRDAGWPNRPLLFVVGLEEGRVFPAAVEDPVLLDKERAKISSEAIFGSTAAPKIASELISAAQRLNDLVAQTLSRLDDAIARTWRADLQVRQIHLSYSCRDLRQFRTTYASWVMLYAFRKATGNPAATYQDLHKATGAPVSTVPATGDEALGRGRWWLRAAARAEQEAGKAAVLDAYAPLAQGAAAETARESTAFTEYDGHVPDAGPVLDPAQDGVVVSPTQLEQAAGCPFRHFLRRGLGVNAIESGDRDRDVWLNPLIRGSLLHDLYAAFLTRCRDEQRVPDERDHAWLQQEGQALLDLTAREMPPPSAEVGERESREFLDDLALFSHAEIETAGDRTPVALEAEFQPTVIQAGDVTISVRGRIDRIDQLRDGTFEILDYKTGSYWDQNWVGTFGGGRRLQHALYGLAATELLRSTAGSKRKAPKVVRATYYFSSAKGRQHRKHIEMPSKADIGKVLGDLREVIASGLYVHTPDDEDCKFCDYGAACGPRAVERAKAKRDDPALHPYRRLADYV